MWRADNIMENNLMEIRLRIVLKWKGNGNKT